MDRYGFGILMFFVGAFVLWATTGFKNPWRGVGCNGATVTTTTGTSGSIGNGTGTGAGNGNGGNGGASGNGSANG